MTEHDGSARLLAIGGIAGPILFTLGWLLAGALEGNGFVSARHDISDLGALTAGHAWLMLTAGGLAGVATIAFALGALRPALRVAGRRETIGPWLLAGSLMGLDNVSDVFFRLPCRAADAGCTAAAQNATTGGHVHMLVGTVTALLTIAAPFVLARRLKQLPDWRRLFWPTIGAGLALVAGLVGYAALDGRWGQGLAMRAMALVMAGWVVALAVRTNAI